MFISILWCSETASGWSWCLVREVSRELLPFHFASHITLVLSQFFWCDSSGPKQLQESCALLTNPERCKPVVASGKLIWWPRRINGSPSSHPAVVCDPRLCPCASCVPVAHGDSVLSKSWEASAGFENPLNCQWWIYHHTYQGLWKHRQCRGAKGSNKAAQHNQWISRHGCVGGSTRRNKLLINSLQY